MRTKPKIEGAKSKESGQSQMSVAKPIEWGLRQKEWVEDKRAMKSGDKDKTSGDKVKRVGIKKKSGDKVK